MPAQPEIITERLRLRPWTLNDLEFCVALNMDPDVGRYLFVHEPPIESEQRDLLRRNIADVWPELGTVWAVERRDDGALIGRCGLKPTENSGLVEISYRFDTAAWGKGIATEAARKVLDLGFGTFEFDPIVAVTHPKNVGSQKVLKNIGLKPDGTKFQYGLEQKFYSLRRADYLISR